MVRVQIEYAPEPRSEFLSDRTAFDVLFEYERGSGGLGFVGIETKLTEPFSVQEYQGPAYRYWTERRRFAVAEGGLGETRGYFT